MSHFVVGRGQAVQMKLLNKLSFASLNVSYRADGIAQACQVIPDFPGPTLPEKGTLWTSFCGASRRFQRVWFNLVSRASVQSVSPVQEDADGVVDAPTERVQIVTPCHDGKAVATPNVKSPILPR